MGVHSGSGGEVWGCKWSPTPGICKNPFSYVTPQKRTVVSSVNPTIKNEKSYSSIEVACSLHTVPSDLDQSPMIFARVPTDPKQHKTETSGTHFLTESGQI